MGHNMGPNLGPNMVPNHIQGLRGSQTALMRDRPTSAYLPPHSPHALQNPVSIDPSNPKSSESIVKRLLMWLLVQGLSSRAQSARDILRQDAKIAEMQEEVRRREARQQQGMGMNPGIAALQGIPPRPQVGCVYRCRVSHVSMDSKPNCQKKTARRGAVLQDSTFFFTEISDSLFQFTGKISKLRNM